MHATPRNVGPLIVTGMHRSGTSMLARLLTRVGTFMGHRVTGGNHEAALFYQINEWLLREAGASWDHPEPARRLIEDAALTGVAGAHVRRVLSSVQLVDYLGMSRFLRYRKLDALDFPWGFKDPRCVLTLPVWLNVFPDARVLYIHRNGVDVAGSLKARSEKQRRTFELGLGRSLPLRARLRPRPYVTGHLTLSMRCQTLDGGFELWKEYSAHAERNLQLVPDERKLVLRFEDFVRDPLSRLADVCRLAGVPHDDEARKQALDLVQPDKADRHRSNPELVSFHREVAPDAEMVRQGYAG